MLGRFLVSPKVQASKVVGIGRCTLDPGICQEVASRRRVCTYLPTVEQPHFRNVVVLAVFRVVMFPVVFRIQIRTGPTTVVQHFVGGILHHAQIIRRHHT